MSKSVYKKETDIFCQTIFLANSVILVQGHERDSGILLLSCKVELKFGCTALADLATTKLEFEFYIFLGVEHVKDLLHVMEPLQLQYLE